MVVSVVKGVSPCVLYVDVNRFYLVMSWLYKRTTFVVEDSRDGSLYIPCTQHPWAAAQGRVARAWLDAGVDGGHRRDGPMHHVRRGTPCMGQRRICMRGRQICVGSS